MSWEGDREWWIVRNFVESGLVYLKVLIWYFTRRQCGKPWKSSQMIAGNPTEFRTGYLLNTT